jgi:type I restriction enzyme S subunit
MEVRKGYKRTEVGVIPVEWATEYLGKRIDIYRGGSPRPIQNYITRSENGINWIKIGDVGVGAKYIDKTDEKIVPEGVLRSRRVSTGDFLLSNSMSFGRPYILRISGCIHDGWLVLQNYQSSFIQDYLYYLLSSNIIIDQYISKASGSSVLNLNKELVASVMLLIPPNREQQAIASALSDVDNLINSLTKLIDKKKNIKQGAMQELLTGKRRLEGFSGEWRSFKLNELLDYEQPTNYIVSCTEYVDKGIPVLTAGKSFILGYTNETSGIFMNYPVIIFDDFTTSSQYVTFAFKVKSSAMKILSLKDTSNSIKLVYELMQMIDFPLKDHQRYWISEYSRLTIKLPTEGAEQTAIVTILSDMDAEIEALEQKLKKYKSIKQGMMQELLTGRIRLV